MHGPTGIFWANVKPFSLQLPDPHSRNRTLQRLLWDTTERLIADMPGHVPTPSTSSVYPYY